MNQIRAPWRTLLALLALTTSAGAAPFEPLFRLVNQKGTCLVRKPGAAAFEPAQRNRAYPYGTTVQIGEDGSAFVELSAENYIQMTAGTIATPDKAPVDTPSNKVVRLEQGKLVTSMRDGLAPDALVIETPTGRCSAFDGNGEITLTAAPDAYTMVAVAAPGASMRIDGPQFSIPLLKAGYSVRILTTRDRTLTRISNIVGDYPVVIDNGTAEPQTIETSTRATIRIWRRHAPVGGRLVVSVFATGSDGKGRECFAFAVGQPMVKSGGALAPVADPTATNEPPAAAEAPAPAAEAPASQTPAGVDPFAM